MRIFEAAGLGMLVLDLLMYFAVFRPLRKMKASAQQEHSEVRQTLRDQRIRVERLQKFQAALPEAAKRLVDFTTERAPSRRQGYSTAAHLIQKAADSAGVKPPSVGFRIDTTHSDPLQRLGLEINTEGSYKGMLKFVHALETSEDFILVREFSFAPGENGVVNLRLGADLYLTP
jgi:Tfp pilus assembly protein PilO